MGAREAECRVLRAQADQLRTLLAGDTHAREAHEIEREVWRQTARAERERGVRAVVWAFLAGLLVANLLRWAVPS